MIPLYTPAQVRAMDERTIAAGTPSLVLMERAAGHLARCVAGVAQRGYGTRVLFVCGRGNNGGDGIAAARRLLDDGVDARVLLVTGGRDLGEDAAAQLRRFRAAGGREVEQADWSWPDVIVDCLLGTGSAGAPREPYATAVAGINTSRAQRHVTVVACDLPTGVDADTGQVPGDAVSADVTLTLGAHKRGLWLWPAAGHCGEVRSADIGILGDDEPAARVLDDLDAARALPPTAPGVDKRGRGVVVVLAGSAGMSGAATLVARGALQTGVGLLTVATSHTVRDLVAPTVPEALTLALPDDEPDEAFEMVAARLEEADALAVGPGLGHSEPTVELVRRLVAQVDVPIVLDADGLNAFRHDGDALAVRAGSRLVCTPHARELARLVGKDVDDVWPDRINTVAEAAQRWDATVVAKGPGTVTALPSGRTWINRTGTAALATGGTGDVLTGMVAAALASSADEDTVAAAVHVHGIAGRLAGAATAPRSVSATAVADAIPGALASLEPA